MSKTGFIESKLTNGVTGLDIDAGRNETVVGVAVDVGLLKVLDRGVAWWGTDVGVSSITLESTVNPQTVDGRVSRGSANHSGNEWDQSCKLHFDKELIKRKRFVEDLGQEKTVGNRVFDIRRLIKSEG
jgi:hypothetical protein